MLLWHLSSHGEEYTFSTKLLIIFSPAEERSQHIFCNKCFLFRCIILARLNLERQHYFLSQSSDLSERLWITWFAAVTLSFVILSYFLATKKVERVLVLEAPLELYFWSTLFLLWLSSHGPCLPLYYWGAWQCLKQVRRDAILAGPSCKSAKHYKGSHWSVSIPPPPSFHSMTRWPIPSSHFYTYVMLWCSPH